MCHNRIIKKPLVPKNKKFKIVKSYDEMIFTMFGKYKYVLFTHIKQKGATTNTTAGSSAMDHLRVAIQCNSSRKATCIFKKNPATCSDLSHKHTSGCTKT